MKDIKAVKGKYYIQRLIEEGEHVHQDFKYAISDARKIARSLSAFANNDGGRLLVGVKDNGAIAGVRSEEDIYVIEQAAEMYCKPPLPVEVTAFACGEGAVVMRVVIERAGSRPVVVCEADGKRRAYYRVADENIAVSPLIVRAWRARAAEATPRLMSIDGVAAELLHLAGEADGTDTDTLMRAAHVSRPTAEDTVVTLHAMGLVDFVYRDGRFVIVATSPE